MRSAFKIHFLILMSVFLLSACFSRGESVPKGSSQARVNVPSAGIVIDANYDKKLDSLVPGYKIMTIAITNRSYDLIRFDPLRDQWVVEDAWGRKQRGITSLRIRDPQTWSGLPPKVKDLIEYPAGVQIGYTQTFDLFFPDDLDLDNFRTISFYSATLKQNFDALSSASLERAVPASEDSPGMQRNNPHTPSAFPPMPSPVRRKMPQPPSKPKPMVPPSPIR